MTKIELYNKLCEIFKINEQLYMLLLYAEHHGHYSPVSYDFYQSSEHAITDALKIIEHLKSFKLNNKIRNINEMPKQLKDRLEKIITTEIKTSV